MFGKALKNIGRGIRKAIKPAPRKPAPVVGFPGGPGGKTIYSTPRKPVGRLLKPVKPGGVGTTGFKSGSGSFASNLFGTGMKKGGAVKKAAAKGKK